MFRELLKSLQNVEFLLAKQTILYLLDHEQNEETLWAKYSAWIQNTPKTELLKQRLLFTFDLGYVFYA